MPMSDREFDLIVYGASGFTGRLVVEYLHRRHFSGPRPRWAVAGRSAGKLQKTLDDLGIPEQEVPVVVADSADRDSLNSLAARTRVALTTVGPYAKYGSDLVAACAGAGTHYCDLAGEVQWMRRMIDAHQATAEQTGARIVHACGFDSIPSDIGTWHLQQEAERRFGQPCSEVTLLVRAMRGGFSGGTATSLLNAVEEGRRNRDALRALIEPYSLNPPGERQGPDGRDQTGAEYDHANEVWTAPFVMGIVNMRVVRRTNALLDFAYGRDFRYREATSMGTGLAGRLKANAAATAFRTFMFASAIDFTRNQVVKRLLPDPGEGPDARAREAGFFNLLLHGSTASQDSIRVRVTGDRDPGYGSTSRMLTESALCLASDELAVGGGFWTPASAMGGPLLERLEAHAGLTFTAEP